MTIAKQDAVEWVRPLVARVAQRDEIGHEEKLAIAAAAGEVKRYPAGTDLVIEGSRPKNSLLMVKGVSCRYRVLAGGQRQLTALHLGGDFVDLHSFLLKEMDHSVGAITECVAVTFPHENLVVLTERFPHLTRLLWLLTLLDASIHREWLVGMGRLSAAQRAAHLICETYTRSASIGLASNNRFDFPITQAAFADALGISAVHVNRVVQDLRQRGLITWDPPLVTILDWPALAALAEFDDRYLHLVREPR